MECRTLEDIARLLMARENIDENEAWEWIDDCICEMRDCMVAEEDPFIVNEMITQVLASNLGLEPDYLDIFLYYI